MGMTDGHDRQTGMTDGVTDGHNQVPAWPCELGICDNIKLLVSVQAPPSADLLILHLQQFGDGLTADLSSLVHVPVTAGSAL